MSTTLTPSEAYDVLVSQVHAPVFFKKLASVYGIQPQSQEEAKELLLIAGQLRNAHEQVEVKEASARTNMYVDARRDLGVAVVQQGFKPLIDENVSMKQAAAEAVGNPLIKEAALVFNHYLHSIVNQDS